MGHEPYNRTPVDGRLGAWLRGVREKRGWSQAYVMRRTRACSTQHLSMVENGQRRPSLALVATLCDFYGVPAAEMTAVLEEQDAVLSPADRDRYSLIRVICELEEDQRYYLHKVVAPLLEVVVRRKAYRKTRHQQQGEE